MRKRVFLMIVTALFLFLLVLLFLPFRIRVTLSDGGAEVRIFGGILSLLRLHLRIVGRVGIYRETRRMCRRVTLKTGKKKHPELRRAIFAALRCEKLHIHMVIGTGDAATTAYLVGCIKTVLARFHEVAIEPYFDGARFSAEGECIISLRLADIIRNVIERRKKNASHRNDFKEHHE